MSDIKAFGQAQAQTRLDKEAALKRAQVAATAGTEHAQKAAEPARSWFEDRAHDLDELKNALVSDFNRKEAAAACVIEGIVIDAPPDDVMNPKHVSEAQQHIDSHQQAVKKAKEKLQPPERRQQFEEVLRTLKLNDDSTGSIRKQLAVTSQAALENMLLSGKFDGPNNQLLSNLAFLSRQTLDDELAKPELMRDRTMLVRELVCEIDNPVAINQKGKGTCATASCQMQLARENPAEYVRIVTDLALPKGVSNVGGLVFKRDRNWSWAGDGDRTLSSQLFQAAGAASVDPTYKNKNDDGKLGISGEAKAKLFSAVLGRRFTHVEAGPHQASRAFIQVQAALDKGLGPIPVGLNYVQAGETPSLEHGHAVLLEKVENGQAYILNPQGHREHLPLETFINHLKSASIPASRT